MIRFVLKRFAQLFVIAFVALTSVYMLRGEPAMQAVTDAGLWSLLAAVVSAGTVFYHLRTRKECKLCVDDTQEPPDSNAPTSTAK